MRVNVRAEATPIAPTHEGGKAERQSALTELRRAVSTCLLFEDTFYETGSHIAERIAALCDHVSVKEIMALAEVARTDLKLRHVPLFLALQAVRCNSKARGRNNVAACVAAVIHRPDEMAEMLALYWLGGKRPLAAQLKKGLAAAFPKFSAYQLAKWNGGAREIKLRDVLFMVHAKPQDTEQAATWKQLVDGTLPIPDTWETALSAGADKKATWERLLRERKLGYMALLMNLRNMTTADVDSELVEQALLDGAATSKALPFRFVTAAKHAPSYAGALSDAMLRAVEGKLDGSTAILVDVSGSMEGLLSAKSQMTRLEAAGALAVLMREIAAPCRVFTFSDHLVEVPNHRGLPLVGAIQKSQMHNGTDLASALQGLKKQIPSLHRLIVVTDEQSSSGIIPSWAEHGYVINVAPYSPGLETSGGWTRINGFSERVVDWMRDEETAE